MRRSSSALHAGNASIQRSLTSIQWTLPLGIVIPLVVGICLTSWLTFRSGQRAVSQVMDQLDERVAENIDKEVKEYINRPITISELLLVQYRIGNLDISDIRKLGRQFQEITQTDLPISNVYYGNQAGEFVYSENQGETTRLDVVDQASEFQRVTYSVDGAGNLGPIVAREDYDHRQRIWFQEAVTKAEPLWTQVYVSKARKSLTLTRSSPIVTATGHVRGVFGIDVFLTELSEFLEQLSVGKTGQAFIIETSGNLVATSTGEDLFTSAGNASDRLLVTDSTNEAVRVTAEQVIDQVGDLEDAEETSFSFVWNGDKQLVHVYPLRESGINWLIVVAVPESDFLATVYADTRRNLVIGVVVAIATAILAAAAALWIIRPIQRLTDAARAILSGTFQASDIEDVLNRSDEFHELASVFNDMATVVISRERSLTDQVEMLKSEIDNFDQSKTCTEASASEQLKQLLTYSQQTRRRLRK